MEYSLASGRHVVWLSGGEEPAYFDNADRTEKRKSIKHLYAAIGKTANAPAGMSAIAVTMAMARKVLRAATGPPGSGAIFVLSGTFTRSTSENRRS